MYRADALGHSGELGPQNASLRRRRTPTSVADGASFAVSTPDAANIGQVTWVRPSAVTHGFNESQRMNRLAFTPGPGAITVTAPGSRNLCPPGHYMLFLLNTAGVPSVARMIEIH